MRRFRFACLLLALFVAAMSNAQKTPGAASTTSNAKNDKVLAEALVELYDNQWWLFGISEHNAEFTDYAATAKSCRKIASSIQASIDDLTRFSYQDPVREAARKAVLHDTNAVKKDWEDMAAALDLAEKNHGWTADAKALSDRAIADSQKISTVGAVDKLLKDSSFQKWLPHLYLENNGLIPDNAGFKLSVVVLLEKPLYIVYVYPGGIGEKLKLESMENIESMNGVVPADMDDFKMQLRALAGQTVHLKVSNEQGAKEFDTLVPSEVAAKAATESPAPSAASQDQGPTDDENLGSVMVTRYDGVLAMDILQQEAQDPQFLVHDLDKRAVAMIPELKAAEVLLSLTQFDDPNKESARDELYKDISSLSDALSDLIEACDKARSAKGWSADAIAEAKKALTAVSGLPKMPHVEALSADPKFQPNLPPIYLEVGGLVKHAAGFSLGVQPLMTDTLFFGYVAPGSIADKLGIKPLMTIESISGETPQDLDDVEQMIKSHRGQTIKVKVLLAFGDEKEIQVAVPAKLGA
jgi:hypothetical protein